MYSQLCKLNQKKDEAKNKDVIYSVICGACGVRYMGRLDSIFVIAEVNIRWISKTKKMTNVLHSHMKKNNGHEIEWGIMCM